MNSPCQYQRICIKKGMENMDSDVRVYRVTKFSIWEDHHVCQNTNLMSENESASADLMLSTKPNKHATLHLLKWRSNSLVRLRSWVVQHLNWVTYSCNWKTILIPNENHQSRLLLIINKLCLFFLLWSCWSHYYALYCPPPPPNLNSWNPLYWDKATTPSLQIYTYFTPDDIFWASKKRGFCF